MTLLSIRNVSHYFSATPALAQVNFELASGEFCILLGRNGAGKTTLFSLLTTLYALRHGCIEIGGVDLLAEPARARSHIGVVFQEMSLDMDLTIRENLLYHGGLHGLSRFQIEQSMATELDQLQLGSRIDDRVRVLSGGLRRRAEIARALLTRPRLLLLDEPTVGLDALMRRAILTHVRDISATRGVAVLWATHLLEEASPSDTLLLLEAGRMRARGSVEKILGKDRSAVERILA
jgi:ABC-2 type transport system ATP-binding protein